MSYTIKANIDQMQALRSKMAACKDKIASAGTKATDATGVVKNQCGSTVKTLHSSIKTTKSQTDSKMNKGISILDQAIKKIRENDYKTSTDVNKTPVVTIPVGNSTGNTSTGNIPAPQSSNININLTGYQNNNHEWKGKKSGPQTDYTQFDVIKSFDASRIMSQYSLHGDANKKCTLTSEMMGHYMLHPDKKFDESAYGGWSSNGCTWPNSTKIEGSSNTKAHPLTVEQQLKMIYDNVSGGNPVVMRVSGHSVLAVGVRHNTDLANIKSDDILVIDPGDGKVKTANEIYGSWSESRDHRTIDTSWLLRVVK